MLSVPLALSWVLAAATPADGATSPLSTELRAFAKARTDEFGDIPADRKRTLKKLALYTRTQLKTEGHADLVFICTHNSRRSHISQLWARAAAAHYGVEGVRTFSGGTEATAFNPRAVAALERAGFSIEKTSAGSTDNPVYEVRHGPSSEPAKAFSKVYGGDPNPDAGFAAVMTCSQADKNCPSVEGASFRIALPFEDPKAADGTPQEAATYDARVEQIAREMMFLFASLRDA